MQKQIIVSCGSDKTIRSWNYHLGKYELIHQLNEEPFAISLHPAGFQIAITFKERVRLYNMQQDGLRILRELSVKSCNCIKFSQGGHLFSCGAGINVSIYRTYTVRIDIILNSNSSSHVT